MNVVVMQQHFRELSTLIRSAGAASKLVDEFLAVAMALEPFRDHSVGTFASFLVRADEFDKTGKVTVTATKSKRETAPKAPKVSKPSDVEILNRLTTLFQGILNPNLTNETIDIELLLVDQLKGAGLQTLATEVGIGEKIKKFKVPDKKAAIKQAIRDRRGIFHRADY